MFKEKFEAVFADFEKNPVPEDLEESYKKFREHVLWTAERFDSRLPEAGEKE
jgi:hypothetical protein